jgi:hypothetical protein
VQGLANAAQSKKPSNSHTSTVTCNRVNKTVVHTLSAVTHCSKNVPGMLADTPGDMHAPQHATCSHYMRSWSHAPQPAAHALAVPSNTAATFSGCAIKHTIPHGRASTTCTTCHISTGYGHCVILPMIAFQSSAGPGTANGLFVVARTLSRTDQCAKQQHDAHRGPPSTPAPYCNIERPAAQPHVS